MSTLAGRRGMRPKMMMPFDTQPPQRKCLQNQNTGHSHWPHVWLLPDLDSLDFSDKN